MTVDDPYDENRATPCVPWKSSRASLEGRQSVCQMGAPTPVGTQNAPVEKNLGHQSADRSETGRSSKLIETKTITTGLEALKHTDSA